MKQTGPLFGQSIRFVEGKSNGESASLIFDVSKALETRYKFLEVPKILSEYELKSGVTFSSGEFNGKRGISKFQIFSNGILSESAEGTEYCDEFFNDVISWVNEKFDLDIFENDNLGRVYRNEMEFESTLPLENLIRPMAFITRSIPELLSKYGQQEHVYEATGLFWNIDPTKAVEPIPSQFTIERRAGRSHDENSYYSRAPLQTRDHIELLTNLERKLSN